MRTSGQPSWTISVALVTIGHPFGASAYIEIGAVDSPRRRSARADLKVLPGINHILRTAQSRPLHAVWYKYCEVTARSRAPRHAGLMALPQLKARPQKQRDGPSLSFVTSAEVRRSATRRPASRMGWANTIAISIRAARTGSSGDNLLKVTKASILQAKGSMPNKEYKPSHLLKPRSFAHKQPA